MNLWAKSLRQLCFAAALFFFSCEDENSFLGYPSDPNNQKFNVAFVEIPLNTSMVLVDSLITDNRANTGALLVGKYVDPVMGPISASAYLQVSPIASSVIPAIVEFDSVTVQFRYNFYSYGFTGEKTQKFTIHELSDSINRFVNHDFNDVVAYNPTPMAETGVTVKYDTLKKQLGLAAASQDTLLATARLSDEFGQRLLALSQSYPFSGGSSELISAQYTEFHKQVKGLVIIPSESEGILGIKLLDGFSKVTIHYSVFNSTTGVTEAQSRSYPFSYASFTNITADRGASELGGLNYYQNTVPSAMGSRYVQSGAPVVTRIDLDKFYEFADTLDNVIINEAELVFGGASSTDGLEAHSSIGIKLMHPNNQFVNVKVANDSANLKYNILAEAGTYHVYVQSDVPSSTPLRAGLVYNADQAKFSGYMTFFVQSLMRYKDDDDGINENRIKHLGLFPNGPTPGYTVNRSILDASQVKLRIYYTKPNLNINP
jgi:hypothetical protein